MALDVRGVRLVARRVSVVISDDSRARTLYLHRRRAADTLGPLLIKADVLELQQSRDGRDIAYVCRGRVEVQRGSLRATTGVLTMDASAQTVQLGPCQLGWGPSAGPQRWTLAGLAQIARRSRVSAKSCQVSLGTGDVLCGGVRAYLPSYGCSEWDGGKNRIRADELSLRFPAGGPAMPPRVEASGFTWLLQPSPPANSPLLAERSPAGLDHNTGRVRALGFGKARWLLHNQRPAASWAGCRSPGLANTVVRAADLEPLPKPAVTTSAVRRLTVRTASTGHSIALRVPVLSTRTLVLARQPPAVRAAVSVRVRVPRAPNGPAASAALRAKWGGGRSASVVATGGLHLLREQNHAAPASKATKATKATEAKVAATATATPSAMARELVLGCTTSSRDASLGPLPMPVASAGGGSLGTDAVHEEVEHTHAASASSPRSILERFTWRVQLPVGEHRMVLDGTQVRLGASVRPESSVVCSLIPLLHRSGCALVYGHLGWRFWAVAPVALRSKSRALVVPTWSRRLPYGWMARHVARPA